jgi:hypothetical protein
MAIICADVADMSADGTGVDADACPDGKIRLIVESNEIPHN